MRAQKDIHRVEVRELSGGGILLQALRDCGVKYVFITSGSEYVSLHADYMVAEREGMAELVTCPYEATAVGMAHGYYLSTGKPQAVLVHTIAGTANALGEVMSAYRAHVPMIAVAGTTPFTLKDNPGARRGWVHWGQDCKDQGEIMRQFVKWDYLVKSTEQIPEAVSRAYEVASQDPPGPVYLAIPREWLTTKVRQRTRTPEPTRTVSSAAPSEAVEGIARELLNADRPIIVTKSVGRNATAVKLLVDVAESLGARVKWALADCMNFPTTHPLSATMKVSQADAILAIDSDVPWFPYKVSPPEGAFTAYVGWNALNSEYTIWGFNFKTAISSDPTTFLAQLKGEIKRLSSSSNERKARERLQTAKEELRKFKDKVTEEAKSDISAGRITKRAASFALNKVKSQEDIVINEYSLKEDYVDFEVPGTYYWAPDSSNLGWGLGAALGSKLGARNRNVIAVLGDGAYILNNPYSAHHVAAWYNLPILTVVFNDSCWGAMKDGVVQYSGEESYYKRHNLVGVDFPAKVRFGPLGKALGLLSYTVEDSSKLIPTLRRAYGQMRKGKHVLVDITITHTP